MQRRTFTMAAMALPVASHAQLVEKPRVSIAVGGRPLLYYLPLTIAESLGYFKAEGLDVTIVDFAGGSPALDAFASGSADVLSAGLMHVLTEQARGRRLRAFVLHGLTLQMVLGINPRTMASFKGMASLRGRRVGVTAPGSITHRVVTFALAREGLKPADVQIVGVGAGNNAVSAMRANQIDALCNLDPVISLLLRTGDIRKVLDLRSVAESMQTFGGPMPSGCLIAQHDFIRRHPRTTQALTNALVRASRWIQAAGAGDILKAVPQSYMLGDRAVYLDAFLAARGGLSPDGQFPEGGAATNARVLQTVDQSFANTNFDLDAVFTNEFAEKANARFRAA